MSNFLRAAYVSQARNMNGSVVCKAAGALPFLLYEGLTVHFVPPTLRGPRTAAVERVSSLREGAWEVSFAGIDSIDDAEAIAGSFCLAAIDDLPDASVEEAPALLVGYAVEDAAFGFLGTVEDVLESAAQATLSVVGERGEVLVPFVEEFVEEVDEGSATVRTRIPQGLLDLNRAAASAATGAPREGEDA